MNAKRLILIVISSGCCGVLFGYFGLPWYISAAAWAIGYSVITILEDAIRGRE